MENIPSPKVKSLSVLASIVARAKKRGQNIVLTNGCFDLLHVGHLRTLQSAKKWGDLLIVALNSDRSVRKLKGAGRPLVNARERAELLAGFSCVDYVTIFNATRPFQVIRKLRPDVHVKGGDYSPTELPEKKLVESLGGRVALVKHIRGHSTTNLLRKAKGA